MRRRRKEGMKGGDMKKEKGRKWKSGNRGEENCQRKMCSKWSSRKNRKDR